MLGEKGIGRLAIAAIDPQVLILRRAIRDDKQHDIVTAFINLGIFESPGTKLVMKKFAPSKDNLQRVTAHSDVQVLFFARQKDPVIYWVAELKSEHAQRVIK